MYIYLLKGYILYSSMNIIILNDRRIEFVGEISFEKFDSFLSIFEYDSNIE